MTTTEKKEAVTRYLDGAKAMEALVAAAPSGAIRYRPFANAWTIAEHVHHLLDSEMSAFIRYRTAVAEPGAPTTPCEPRRPRDSMLALSMVLRVVARHLERISGEDWTRYAYEYPGYGVVTLEQWISLRADHLQEHIEDMSRNLRLFRGRHRSNGRRAASPHAAYPTFTRPARRARPTPFVISNGGTPIHPRSSSRPRN